VKHAASVRPEPGSNSPNKNPGTNPAEFESEKSDHKQKTPNKLASKKQQPHPKREKERGQKQQTKTTKHTIEFSNNRLFCFVALFWGNPASLIRTLLASQVASSRLISSDLRQPRQLSTISAGLSSRSGPGSFSPLRGDFKRLARARLQGQIGWSARFRG
ncbi:urea transporter, partial [Mycolicibacterium fortuitum]|uniref:urea transporter n=1 Tax=Mycolicibacterium fortuitum TaxID=1766 RepID=UPI001CE1F339